MPGEKSENHGYENVSLPPLDIVEPDVRLTLWLG